MNVLLKKRIGRTLTMLTTIALMAGCSSTVTAPEDTPPALFSELEKSSTFYLNKDQQLGSEKNLTWQFLAVQALTAERKFIMADAVIESLQSNPLSAHQSATLGLLIADNHYAQNKLPETQAALTAIDQQQLDPAELIHYLKLQVELHIRNELPLEASDTLLTLTTLLTTDEDKQAYNDLLLAQLILLPSEQLNQYNIDEASLLNEEEEVAQAPTSDVAPLVSEEEALAEAPISEAVTTPVQTIEEAIIVDDVKAGWYALASLYQANKMRPNRLTRALDRWKVTYSDHPVLEFMPLVLTNIAVFSPYHPDNIAVLLPLSGRFEKQGKAIQIGLLNAYYNQSKATGTEASERPKLHFFDTQTVNSEQLALQLKQTNIDFVVGPLMKQQIEGLLPLIEDMPVLALNSFTKQAIDSPQNLQTKDALSDESENTQTNDGVAWHYAFPLSPEEEAKQAAVMIHSDQHKNPLIIVPDSAYGQRVAKAFTDHWATLTPESDVKAEAYYFQTKAKLDTFIDNVLQTDKSKRRISQMKAITKVPLKTEVRSRRDIDAIYIVSKRDELILLKPFIDVSVSPFAKKIPLYASSRSHSVDRHNMQNKELSRLVFSDSPFLLDPDNALKKEIESAWERQPFSTLRLFALGFDSYHLIEQLIYLQNADEATYKGLIGELSLDTNNSIEAQLSWAKYQDGELYEVATPTTAE